MARSNTYDVILMALQILIMNSCEAPRQIRAFNPDIPIIAVLAAAMNDMQALAFTVGITNYVIKPNDLSQKILGHRQT